MGVIWEGVVPVGSRPLQSAAKLAAEPLDKLPHHSLVRVTGTSYVSCLTGQPRKKRAGQISILLLIGQLVLVLVN